MVKDVYNYISRFITLSPEEFKQLEQLLVLRSFKAGEKLINVGDIELYLNFVTKGVVRKFFYKGKNEIVSQLAKEGDLTSSSVSFLSGKPSTYVLDALIPVEVISITRNNLEHFYKLNPKFERLGMMVIIDWLLQKEYWEYERLCKTPRERFADLLNNNPTLFDRVPQKILASYLNIKPETFSRYKHLVK